MRTSEMVGFSSNPGKQSHRTVHRSTTERVRQKRSASTSATNFHHIQFKNLSPFAPSSTPRAQKGLVFRHRKDGGGFFVCSAKVGERKAGALGDRWKEVYDDDGHGAPAPECDLCFSYMLFRFRASEQLRSSSRSFSGKGEGRRSLHRYPRVHTDTPTHTHISLEHFSVLLLFFC